MSGLGPVIAFGEFRLDAQRRILSSGPAGVIVPLNARAFEALLHLSSRPGVLVSKSELMAAVWPDVTVEENSLSQCISSLRRALGEEPGDNRYIVTETGRGYRFIGASPVVPSGARKPSARSSVNSHAYQLYVSGWSALTRPAAGNLERGLAQLEKAVQLDPEFALAHVCVADGFALLGVFGIARPRDVADKARQAVLKALAIDANLAEAHAELAHILWAFDLDYAGAETACRRALEIDPRSVMAHHYMGLQSIGFARFDLALHHLRQAQAEEPLAANINANIGITHYYAGRYHEAMAQLQAALDLDLGFSHARSFIGRCLLRLGEFDRALAEFQNCTSATLGSAADIPEALALAGRTAEARAHLDGLERVGRERYISPYDLATINAGLGDKAAVLHWLGAAIEESAQPINFLAVDPAFNALRSMQIFQRLLRRLKVG